MAAKITSLRFGGNCTVCGTSIAKYQKAWWDSNTHIVKCLTCFDPGESSEDETENKEAFVMSLRFGGNCTVCGTSIAKYQKAWWNPVDKTMTCSRCKPIPTSTEPGDKQSQKVLEESDGSMNVPVVVDEFSDLSKVNLAEMQPNQVSEIQEDVKAAGEQNVSSLSHEQIQDEKSPELHCKTRQVKEKYYVSQPVIEHSKVTQMSSVPLIEEMAVPPADLTVQLHPPIVFPSTIGVAGASARKEYERRQQKRVAKIEKKYGKLAPVIKFLFEESQSTKAWAKGSEGERKLAEGLARQAGDRTILLHDCKVPKTKGNIDHIAISSSGIWVIDAKRYRGMVEKRDVGGWFTTDIRLYVGGRDRTKLAKGLQWQVEAVKKALARENIPINAALCFVDAEWKLFGKPFQIEGTWVTWGLKLSEMIASDGPLGRAEVIEVAMRLTEALPPNDPGNPN